MKNCPMIPALSLAVWRLGGAFCPLNVASGMTALLRTLDLIEPFGVIVSDSVKKEVGNRRFRGRRPPEDPVKFLKNLIYLSFA